MSADPKLTPPETLVTALPGSDEAALLACVSVQFDRPVPGPDFVDGTTFTSDRHRVASVRMIQDASETVFLSVDGEILARWSTQSIVRIDWPAAESDDAAASDEVEAEVDRELAQTPPFRVGSVAWLAEIRACHPRAYEAWPEPEDSDLRAEFANGCSIAEMAERHQRRPSAIRSRLRKLELV